ncbi:phosphoenolpyruvate carboxykinase (ATP) [Elioraea thermophila]|uniref:phosphoenolpyruvate carboxykinase (ATP) n=1 Tax=Elioraea thermophila TaxID=2185104 RepID=UPI000DF3A80D|nr:phosphoenolpyruvate carboxykinase (ATP) [Elioraea thermophila]
MSGLDIPGLVPLAAVHRNLAPAALIEAAIARGEAHLSASGGLVVETGEHTGRSPNDKYLVEDDATRDAAWWGAVNKPLARDRFALLRARAAAHLAARDLWVQDCFAGADPAYRIAVRVLTPSPWHALFARTMFLRPAAEELASFRPDWTILHAPDLAADPALDGVRSTVAIALDVTSREIVIAGTRYAGEIKKSIFTVLNWLLPERGVLPMHCSANVGPAGDVALFFGLSGTGKTTLSSDPARALIGDDEHGWSPTGVFNLEGGCYAKAIRLDAEAEPQIWRAVHRFGAILENVTMDPATRALDLDDASRTENTRASFPIEFIPQAVASGRAGHPRNIVFLTADAFGVLPPIARLTPDQAVDHFLAGYTARVAGTEKGLGAEPEAVFSPCFGGPFLPRPPVIYGRMLKERIARHEVRCWLVNTGWTGGGYGVGRRMSIATTRALLSAALSGRLDAVPFRTDPRFGLAVPTACPGVDPTLLDPRATWADPAAYDVAAAALAARFAAVVAPLQAAMAEDARRAA